MAKNPSLWQKNESPFTAQNIDDLLTYLILGIILGGRVGYVLFYNLQFYLDNPYRILYLWEGGMSFHGGFIGVILGAGYFALRNNKSLLSMGDIVALSTPPGLLLGRLANFINQELWGKPTTSALGIQFTAPQASICPETWASEICIRHPSQLYEATLEGLILGVLLFVLVFYFKSFKFPGLTMGTFFVGYGLSRIFVENFREADLQYISNENPLGYVIFLPGNMGLTMGQTLSLPMVIIGTIVILFSLRKFRGPANRG